MKIVFLDVDGVLNTPIDVIPGTDGYRRIDPASAALLAGVLEVTGAQLVIASGWRQIVADGDMSLRGFGYFLMSHGIVSMAHPNDLVYGVLPGGWIGTRKASRSELIRAWLAEHPEVSSYVVLDDEDLGFREAGLKLVQPEPTRGLGSIEVAALIEALQ